jgi:hypothetical protein
VGAGDELEARVELVPRSTFEVRNGKVELICTETYVQKTSSQYGTHYQKKTLIRFSDGQTFSDNGTIRSGVKYTRGVRLIVPPDAPRSVQGTSVRNIQPGITWEVRASLDVANARDLQESQDVTVIEVPAVDALHSRSVVAEEGHRQGNFVLEISSGDVRSGARLEGVLRLDMLQEVTAAEIRVELVREEKFGNDTQEHVVDQVTLDTHASLNADAAREWRFHLEVGNVDVPSLTTDKSSVRWLVKGVLARAMRPDLRVEQDIVADF